MVMQLNTMKQQTPVNIHACMYTIHFLSFFLGAEKKFQDSNAYEDLEQNNYVSDYLVLAILNNNYYRRTYKMIVTNMKFLLMACVIQIMKFL